MQWKVACTETVIRRKKQLLKSIKNGKSSYYKAEKRDCLNTNKTNLIVKEIKNFFQTLSGIRIIFPSPVELFKLNEILDF